MESQGAEAQSQWEQGPGFEDPAFLPRPPPPPHREYPCSASALGSQQDAGLNPPCSGTWKPRELLMPLSLSTPLRSETSDLASLFPAAPPSRCTPRTLFYSW